MASNEQIRICMSSNACCSDHRDRLYEYCIICILNSHRFYIIHKLKIIKSLFINEEQPFVAFCVNHYLIYFGDMYVYL